jgi:hypothetical protein
MSTVAPMPAASGRSHGAVWRTGIQGALLARALGPVYLASLTVGECFDAGALGRAVGTRLRPHDAWAGTVAIAVVDRALVLTRRLSVH